jgi:DNA invertase Pin-like site-specific DNA recombinase
VDGFGLNVQTRTIVDCAGNGRMDIVADEGVSGTVLDRPALGELILSLVEGDVVYVARLDRLARDLITQELLLRAIRAKGADVVSCQEGENAYLAEDAGDPSRKLIRQILGAVAEYERDMIALRTQAGKRAKLKAGGYAGGQPPYGWTGRNGELWPVESEQQILAIMWSLRSRGFDYAHIADTLNQADYPTRARRSWTRTSVRGVLLRGPNPPAGAVRQESLGL